MPTFNNLVRFDRPLRDATIAGQARLYTEKEIAAIREEARRAGADAASAFANQQLVDHRHEVQQIQDGLFRGLSTVDAQIVAQLRDALPMLALEIARRLLAGYEPPAEVVTRHCHEVLEALYPERENLELYVCPRDAALLEKMHPGWTANYPSLRITADPMLAPGDCQVRSRFGITDARLSTKMEELERELGAG